MLASANISSVYCSVNQGGILEDPLSRCNEPASLNLSEPLTLAGNGFFHFLPPSLSLSLSYSFSLPLSSILSPPEPASQLAES